MIEDSELCVGDIVMVRAGAYTTQSRCAAMVTKIGDTSVVDLTVFPAEGVAPFAIKAVRRQDADYLEASDKEIFWHRRT